jgi:hypothetical protein
MEVVVSTRATNRPPRHHLPECQMVPRMVEGAKIRLDRDEAEARGFSPCQLCFGDGAHPRPRSCPLCGAETVQLSKHLPECPARVTI